MADFSSPTLSTLTSPRRRTNSPSGSKSRFLRKCWLQLLFTIRPCSPTEGGAFAVNR